MDVVDVMFRIDKEGICFALFPGIAGTPDPGTCTCYEHVGQHSTAQYRGCVRTSRPAKPAEYARLMSELQRIGYGLRMVKRATWKERRWTQTRR